MTVETDDDRTALLEDFGETFTISGNEFTAIPDEAFADEDDIESNEMMIRVKASDVSDLSIARGSTLTRSADSSTWAVREIQDDNRGLDILRLEAQ